MKTGPVNIYQKESFSMDAINYYFYDLIIKPFHQSIQEQIAIPIIVEYDYPDIFKRIHSNYVESRDDNNVPELFDHDSLSNNYMRSKFNLQTAENIRIPIMDLIESKWGANYVESIFNFIYSELEGQIPYSLYNVTRDINDFRSNSRLLYANEVLLINDYYRSEEVFNDCNQILKGVRRAQKLDRISQRMLSRNNRIKKFYLE